MRKIITLIRAHGLLNRAHGLLNRAHGILSRAHGLARLNNYFPHGTAGAPYISYPNGWLILDWYFRNAKDQPTFVKTTSFICLSENPC